MPDGQSVDKALETYHRQMERPGPKERNIKNVARWLDGNKPLALPESSFMNNWDDLVAPSDALDHGGLDAVVANVGALLHRWRMPMVHTSHSLRAIVVGAITNGWAKVFTNRVSLPHHDLESENQS